METKVKLYLGDCFDILPQINDGSIDIVFTDPPWNISTNVVIRRGRNPKKYKYIGTDIVFDFGEWDHFPSKEEYLDFIFRWLKEAYRVLRKGGHCLMFFDRFKISYVVEEAEKLGFKVRQPLFWKKSNPVPEARKVCFMNSMEMIIWLTKDTISRKWATFNYELGQHSEVFECGLTPLSEKKFGKHPTQKPVKLIKEILAYLSKPGEILLDPFMGSGSIIVGALEMELNAIGIEINPKYFHIAQRRVNSVKPLIFENFLTSCKI